ncbi:hypothetical protein [uncultured Aquimarina sp.]|uniref:hypothetical protein n=1 Tax=uncultured Aquimarina sp. TaxID=575652 RepID=UPI002628F94C|nr:hypothetical protein [uncultured Aquimarina sp.]
MKINNIKLKVLFSFIVLVLIISCQPTLNKRNLKIDDIPSNFNVHKFYEESLVYDASADTIKVGNPFSGRSTQFGIQYNQGHYMLGRKVAEFYKIPFERIHMRVDNEDQLSSICAVGFYVNLETILKSIKRINEVYSKIEISKKFKNSFKESFNPYFWKNEDKQILLFWNENEEKNSNSDITYKVYLYITDLETSLSTGNYEHEKDWKYYIHYDEESEFY